MYEQGVRRLRAASAQAGGLGGELKFFADGLDGSRWGAGVIGAVHDAGAGAAEVGGLYGALADRMALEGAQGAAARDAVPWAPEAGALGIEVAGGAEGEGWAPMRGTLTAQEPRRQDADEWPVDGETTANEELFTVCTLCDDPLEDPVADRAQAKHLSCAEAEEGFTYCSECGDDLDEVVHKGAEAMHPECDPHKPPQYALGEPGRSGGFKKGGDVETFRRLSVIACEVVDAIARCELEYGALRVKLPGPMYVDAREWGERPEVQRAADIELAPYQSVQVTHRCETCGAELQVSFGLRGKLGETCPFEHETTCGACQQTQLVQGRVAISDEGQLAPEVINEFRACVKCGTALGLPVWRASVAKCAACDRHARSSVLCCEEWKGTRVMGSWLSYADELELALELVDARDRGLLADGVFKLFVPSRKGDKQVQVDAAQWLATPEIVELARENAAGCVAPNALAGKLAQLKSRRPGWALQWPRD